MASYSAKFYVYFALIYSKPACAITALGKNSQYNKKLNDNAFKCDWEALHYKSNNNDELKIELFDLILEYYIPYILLSNCSKLPD